MNIFLYFFTHLLYGFSMGNILWPLIAREKDLFGKPLFGLLLPVVFGTAPLGTLLMRYAGSWFVFFLIQPTSIVFEQLYFFWSTLLMVGVCLFSITGFAFGIYMTSHQQLLGIRRFWTYSSLGLILFIILFYKRLFFVNFSQNHPLWTHSAGLGSLLILCILGLTLIWAKKQT